MELACYFTPVAGRRLQELCSERAKRAVSRSSFLAAFVLFLLKIEPLSPEQKPRSPTLSHAVRPPTLLPAMAILSAIQQQPKLPLSSSIAMESSAMPVMEHSNRCSEASALWTLLDLWAPVMNRPTGYSSTRR